MAEGNIWAEVVALIRAEIDPEEYRRWFLPSAYASDSGDQITVWVPAAADGRYISQHYNDRLQRALRSLGRTDTLFRFVAIGYADDEDEEDET